MASWDEGGAPEGTVDRTYQALLLRKGGHSLESIAATLPNYTAGGSSISVKSVEIILRQGARVIVSCIGRHCDPPGAPAELLPPPDVRQSIVEQAHWRGSLAVYRKWLEQDCPPEKPRP